MHSFQFHLGDYYSHTSHLSLTEDLAYRRIIDFYYLHELAPTGRPDQIARLIRMPKEVAAVEQVLNEFFCQELSDSGDNPLIVWRHKRCDVEIEKYQSFKVSGKRGANMRWAKGADGGAIGGLSGGEQNPNSNQEPITNNQEPVTNNQLKNNSARKRAPVINRPEEVTEQAWDAFLVHRKSKRAPVTDVVMEQIELEAKKVNMSLDAALREICARGWTGFKAEWVRVSPNSQPAKQDRKSALIFGDWSANVIDMEDANGRPIPLR